MMVLKACYLKRAATMNHPSAECPVTWSKEATLDAEETTLDGNINRWAWGSLDQIRHPCLLVDWVSLTRGDLDANYAPYASHTYPLGHLMPAKDICSPRVSESHNVWSMQLK